MNIEWKEAYKIGNADLDQQHQHLFELASALAGASDQPNVRQLLMQFYKHGREHFSAEEALMRSISFPDVRAHSESHNNLLTKLNSVSSDVGQGIVDKQALEVLMTAWLGHISHDDAKIAAFVAQQKKA
jgi:hemerythrin